MQEKVHVNITFNLNHMIDKINGYNLFQILTKHHSFCNNPNSSLKKLVYHVRDNLSCLKIITHYCLTHPKHKDSSQKTSLS